MVGNELAHERKLESHPSPRLAGRGRGAVDRVIEEVERFGVDQDPGRGEPPPGSGDETR